MGLRRSSNLLIVNADDLGLSPEESDAILETFRVGAITSATGLVWMSDSDRAAGLAQAASLPVGLHLNLIEPFTALDVPEEIAATQRRVVGLLSSRRPDAYLYHPGWKRDFERCIADQLTRFVELYGRPPTHVDGHRHMHLVPNALFSRALGSVRRCRRPVNRLASESRAEKRVARTLLSAVVRWRFQTTDWCFSIRALEPALGGVGVERSLAEAAGGSVEVMVHPGWPEERSVLLDADWRERLVAHRLGSFADLGPDR
jgi:chitin disaccharide deacetylase